MHKVVSCVHQLYVGTLNASILNHIFVSSYVRRISDEIE